MLHYFASGSRPRHTSTVACSNPESDWRAGPSPPRHRPTEIHGEGRTNRSVARRSSVVCDLEWLGFDLVESHVNHTLFSGHVGGEDSSQQKP